MKWCHPAHHGRPAASCHLGTHRGGFTLVELVIVALIVGILAGIALPALRNAIYKADAARLAQDAHTISTAAFNYLVDNNRFPPNTAYGSIPVGLEAYLPENFRFSYKGVLYRWYPMTYPNSDNVWGTRFVGLVMFDYAEEEGIGQAMYSYSGPLAYWSATYFYFYYLG